MYIALSILIFIVLLFGFLAHRYRISRDHLLYENKEICTTNLILSKLINYSVEPGNAIVVNCDHPILKRLYPEVETFLIVNHGHDYSIRKNNREFPEYTILH